jgi:homoserine acetyltransferase
MIAIMAIIISLGADEGVKSPVSIHTAEGKSVYTPVQPPVDVREEIRIQERDQNATYHGSQK